MSNFFGWLAASAVTIISVLIVWYVVKHAFKWADAGPWGVLLLILSAVITMVAARLFLVPLIDDLYSNVKGDVADSAMAADIVGVLGAAPKDLGFSGEGATVLDQQAEGQVPTTGEEVATSETQIIVAAEPAVSVAAPTMFEFAHPYVVTSTTNLLILEKPDGQVIQVDVTGIETMACALDLRRIGPDGKPTHAYACPPSDGKTFAISQVTLPSDFPTLPAGLLPQPTPVVTAPEGSGGGGGNWLVGGESSGTCLKRELTRLGFENSTQFGTAWLPQGTSWTLSYPGTLGAWFTFAGNEKWALQSLDWRNISFKINGVLARAMGPQADVNSVFGIGPVPEACR